MNTFLKALAITLSFEGHSYDKLAGNFDKMGWSFGILGFNLGQGTLQKLLLAMYEKDKIQFRNAATVIVNYGGTERRTDLTAPLLSLCNDSTPEEAIQWVTNSTRLAPDGKPAKHWIKLFSNLGAVPEFKEVQQEFAKPYYSKALKYCKLFNLNTERAACFFFDLCVQQGGVTFGNQATLKLKGVGRLASFEKMRLIADVVASRSKNYKQDCLSRRLAIINGKGDVHGAYRDINREFHVSDGPIS